MSDRTVRVGIDPRGDWYYVARVAWGLGRPQVKALARFNSDQLRGHKILSDAQAVWGIPDSQAQVKRVEVTPSGDIDPHDLAAFELAQSVLDDPSEFCLAAAPLSLTNQYLGMTIRRSVIEDTLVGSDAHTPRWQVRSVALAGGWTTFGRGQEGELIGMVDFTPDSVTISILHHYKLATVARVSTDRSDLNTESGRRKLAAELRTVVDFKLETLSEHGITVPLSALVLCGADLAEGLHSNMERFFKVPMVTPSVAPGFFPQSADLSSVPLDRYLIALGLTVGRENAADY